MPIYVYEIIDSDCEEGKEGKEGETFEVLQGMNEPPLTNHPMTGQPVRRCISLPSAAGMWSDMKTSTSLSDKNLDAKGFTKYVKMGDGMYEKRAGQGPDVISANDY